MIESTRADRKMTLNTLPYDLLLNIANRLDIRDVHALHLTCKSLYDFSTTRPVYRTLATELLRRCRALPLKGFQRLTDLTTEQLIRSVNKAARYESAWPHRGPRPVRTGSHKHTNYYSNYMDVINDSGLGPRHTSHWYKVVRSPPEEEVDWLSPITSNYTLCATKSGKVVCWDVQTDKCLAEWSPGGSRWELWKCRVEFEEKTVFFTMAKIISGGYDDSRVMEFILMRLRFSDGPSGESALTPPIFSHVTGFKTAGVVMNVFLLDPVGRLLSGFVWLSTSNTIALYALLDWDKSEYVYIDTGIECVASSNWSCILFEQNIVIHCEDSEKAYQYFYPLHLLRTYVKPLKSKEDIPILNQRVSPARALKRKFNFPPLPIPALQPTVESPSSNISTTSSSVNGISASQIFTSSTPSSQLPPPNPNPFPFPPWCPDSAHFVRQWWPSLPGIPRVSCTVVLLSAHDQETHRTRFVLAQHYFKVPLTRADWLIGTNRVTELGSSGTPMDVVNVTGCIDDQDHTSNASPVSDVGSSKGRRGTVTMEERERDTAIPEVERDDDSKDDSLMNLWYVSTPFEVVCLMEGTEDEEEGAINDRPRPLIAVDFGHAVWIEFVDNEDDMFRPRGSDPDAKWLRFVTFPPYQGKVYEDGTPRRWPGGDVRTLEIPDELDLDDVETINIDQSQGAVILSVREGKIFILCYE